MEIEEIKATLHRHAGLRMPMFTADDSAGFKIGKLEDYLGEVAVARGDLEEARLWADHARHELEDTWNKVEGWEQMAGRKATGPQITEAKRRVRPDIYDAMREVKWLVTRLSDQIKRLELDEQNASRRYTLIVGG